VDAVCASTAPAASTGVCEHRSIVWCELGHLVGSATVYLRLERTAVAVHEALRWMLDRTAEGRLANRLREQLYRVDAAWLTLCPAADEPWLWTVLAETPHPDAWRLLPRRRVTPALRVHRIRRVTADEILTLLRHRGCRSPRAWRTPSPRGSPHWSPS
jgi:hypothetical protein